MNTFNKACIAELHISVETRCRPDLDDIDDIDAANILAVIEQLQAKVAELEEENARLKAAVEYAETIRVENIAYFEKQLATSQLRETQLRKALEAVIKVHGYESGIPVEALAQPSDTFALDAYVAEKVKDSESRTGNQSPCYTIARDMAVRMWEKHYKTDAPSWEPLDDFMGVLSQISNMLTGLGNVEKITRQRDLAVEALEKWDMFFGGDAETAVLTIAEDPSTLTGCQKATKEAMSAIRECEAK